MATDVEIDRALAAISATLNDQRPEEFDRRRMRELVTGAPGSRTKLKVLSS